LETPKVPSEIAQAGLGQARTVPQQPNERFLQSQKKIRSGLAERKQETDPPGWPRDPFYALEGG